MSRTSVSIALGVCIFFAVSPLRADDAIKPNAAEPVLTFDGQTVKAANITPGGQVVYFAAAYVPSGYRSRIIRWSQAVADDDRDGIVTLDAGRPIPGKSIWVVADLTNGHFAVAAPPDRHLRRIPFDKSSLRKNAKGELGIFLHPTPFLDFLYVHPGKGAWTIKVFDNDQSDADGTSNGVAAVALSSARPLAGDAAPKDFVPGGILVAIDLYRLNVVAERLDGQMLAEVQQ